MTKIHKILLACFVLLALFAAGLWWQNTRPVPQVPPDFDRADAVLLQKDGVQLRLQKTASGWVLPDHSQYPADKTAIGNLLYSLRNMKNHGAQAWGAEKIQAAGLEDGHKGRVLLQVRDETGATLANWMLGDAIADGDILARQPGGTELYRLSLQPIPSLELTNWTGDAIAPLRGRSFTQIRLGTGTPNGVDLLSSGASAWRIANLPKRKNATPGNAVERVPGMFDKAQILEVAPVSALRPDSTERNRAWFVTADGMRLILTQARSGGKTWTHFHAEPIFPAKREEAATWNARNAAWAYAMDAEFNALIGLRMENVLAKPVS